MRSSKKNLAMSERQPLSFRDHIETRLVSTDEEWKRFATPIVRDNLLSPIFGMMASIGLRYMPGIFSEEPYKYSLHI
jgi:hypothetical protein